MNEIHEVSGIDSSKKQEQIDEMSKRRSTADPFAV